MKRLFAFAMMGVFACAQTATSRLRTPSVRAAHSRQATVERDGSHVFPYLLSSASWTTTIHITNLEDHPIEVGCEVVSSDGSNRELTFDFDPDHPTAFTTTKLPALSTSSFQTVSSAASLTAVWMYCAAEPRTERYSGSAIVRYTYPNGSMRDFVVSMQPESEPVFSIPFLPAEDNTTALILVNTALEGNSSLGIWMVDPDGKQVAARSLTLQPGAMRLIVLNDEFKDVKQGTVRVVVVDGGKLVTGMALRTSAAGYAALMPMSPKQDPPPAN
ncbi:MAG: hypothetical protein HY821_07840 [Acidobacteria bacterium]|nr:hypothetical protein [Acidobacteriota bacterium]